ncbi:MAG: RNA methyltransferase [Bacteroidales bacterium]|nr:RNA methyltransferase [Bacteroidales bacterium]
MTDLIDSLDITTKKALAEYLREFVMEERNERLLSVLKNRTRHFTVVLEDLYQTQNISAVMRTCECYGVQDIHIIENENEFTTHSAITMGADKWLTISNYKRCEGNVRQCADRLHAAGYTLVATLPAENSVFIEDLPIDQKTAFFFGTELTGLSDEAKAVCDRAVKIPMYGFTESFNISNSVAILISNVIERLHRSAVEWHLNEDEQTEIYFDWLRKSARSADELIDRYLTTHPSITK